MNVLISGASIAGPALAHWLHRSGHAVTIVERAPSIRSGGYAIDIRGPGLDVITAMGLREIIRPFETDTRQNEVVDSTGRRFGRMERGFGVIDPGDIEVHRGDLARILFDATKALTEYRFDDSITALHEDATGVDVTFAKGTTTRFDLVIGADGIHSAVRALTFGKETDFLHYLGCEMAIFSTPNLLGLHREQLLFTGIGRIASIKSADDDQRLKLCVFFESPLSEANDRSPDSQRRRVREAFSNAGYRFPELLDALDDADDFYCDLSAQIRLPKYARGRIALVGDAACCPSPMSGQGTTLALVGAWILGDALGRMNVDAAFAHYDATMRPYAERNQLVGLDIAKGFMPKTKLARVMRDWVMRSLPYMPWASMVMKLGMRGVREASNGLRVRPGVNLLPSP